MTTPLTAPIGALTVATVIDITTSAHITDPTSAPTANNGATSAALDATAATDNAASA